MIKCVLHKEKIDAIDIVDEKTPLKPDLCENLN